MRYILKAYQRVSKATFALYVSLTLPGDVTPAGDVQQKRNKLVQACNMIERIDLAHLHLGKSRISARSHLGPIIAHDAAMQHNRRGLPRAAELQALS